MITLGIESSCDETAVSIVDRGKVLASLVASQHDVHQPYGGVVPELASRRHLETIIPLVREALVQGNLTLKELEGVAVTHAPGLVGALLVGVQAAKGIALALNLPLIGVNHLEGHINAVLLEYPQIPYPYLVLVISGGHTSLYEVHSFGTYHLWGETRDDAAGEAYDKVGKLLGLPFPGGPMVDKLAQSGNPKAYRFTKPRFQKSKAFDFSFSGIKTAVSLAYQQLPHPTQEQKADIAASFQQTVVDFVVERLMEAQHLTKTKALVISGGVAANSLLRQKTKEAASREKVACCIPSMEYCTDNAAMIASVGERYLQMGKRSDFSLNAIAHQEIGREVDVITPTS